MSSTALKLLALGLMLLDHIHEFIPGTPLILTILGRISAPVFFFCTVWGFHYTRSRGVYLMRLYDCSALMGILDCLLNRSVGTPYQFCRNNIFATLFLVCLFIYLWEKWESPKRKLLAVGLFLLLNEGMRLICRGLLASPLPTAMDSMLGINRRTFFTLLWGFCPNYYNCEGGLWAVAMGLVLHFCKGSKKNLGQGFGIYCALYLAYTVYNGWMMGETDWISFLFRYWIQWLQVLALPVMLQYNGSKGRGLKYLFYGFYPAHIALLFYLGNRIAGKI